MGVELGNHNANASGLMFEKTLCCPSAATSSSEACSPSETGQTWSESLLCSDGYVPIKWTPKWLKNDKKMRNVRAYQCCPAGATELTDDCEEVAKCASYGMDCVAAPEIKCPDEYKPMGTGELGSFKDTPAGKKGGSFVPSLIGGSMGWYIVIGIISGAATVMTWKAETSSPHGAAPA